MKCPSCAKELKQGLKFCPHCGMRISQSSGKKAAQKPSSGPKFVTKKNINSSAKWKSFLSILLFLGITSCAYFIYDNYSIEKNYRECILNRKTGNYKVAAGFCEKTLKRRPRKIQAWEELAQCYSDANMDDKALGTVKTAMKWGDTSMLNAILGELYFKKEKYDDSEKALEKALKLDDANITANHYMGFILYEKKEYQKALGHLDKALKDADRADFMVLNDIMGDAYAALGNHKNAIESYKNVLSKDMNILDVCLKLTKQYLANSNLESAYGEIQRCSLISPENEEAQDLKTKIRIMVERVEIIKYVKARKNMDDVFMMIYSSVTSFIERVNRDSSAFIGQPAPELDDAIQDTATLLENYRKLAPPGTYVVVHTQVLAAVSTMNDTLGYIKKCVYSGELQQCSTLDDYTDALQQRVTDILNLWDYEKKDPELKKILEAPMDPAALLSDTTEDIKTDTAEETASPDDGEKTPDN